VTEDPPLIVVKAGDTFPELIRAFGDFEDWIIQGLGPACRCRVVNVEKGEALPPPGELCGAVISGAHSMVTQNFDWSLKLEAWTRDMVDAQIPLLGICYGHQILARTMGGRVDFHPDGAEIGATEISCLSECKTDPLFSSLPETFKAHVFHSQSVIQLPEDAVLLARNEFEPHHAFRMGKAAWGVQFHPEAFAAATRGYILNLADTVKDQGQNPDQLIDSLEDTPHAAALLRRFGRLTRDKA